MIDADEAEAEEADLLAPEPAGSSGGHLHAEQRGQEGTPIARPVAVPDAFIKATEREVVPPLHLEPGAKVADATGATPLPPPPPLVVTPSAPRTALMDQPLPQQQQHQKQSPFPVVVAAASTPTPPPRNRPFYDKPWFYFCLGIVILLIFIFGIKYLRQNAKKIVTKPSPVTAQSAAPIQQQDGAGAGAGAAAVPVPVAAPASPSLLTQPTPAVNGGSGGGGAQYQSLPSGAAPPTMPPSPSSLLVGASVQAQGLTQQQQQQQPLQSPAPGSIVPSSLTLGGLPRTINSKPLVIGSPLSSGGGPLGS